MRPLHSKRHVVYAVLMKTGVRLCLGALGCGTSVHQSPAPGECEYVVDGPAQIPDASAYEGGKPYGGDLPQSECQELCRDPRSAVACTIESRDPTKIRCTFACF